ncbi:MAG TPA: hypothetical protein VE954_43015 [Oligoflexus sp.]|uniref:hypothetical protein n=1 Tax=Oligoflexus sp. TaxID=1971216 RepID=UPI002D2AE476|nr:hypothetical protein [Oligoflexus sp.]HYX39915.1 hypothetical protein [Oligoflexus sp.]
MQDFRELFIAVCVGLVILAVLWIRRYGWQRGLMAFVLRVGWVAPILLAVFPRMDKDLISSSVSLKTIHILRDDSASMNDPESQARTENLLGRLDSSCRQMACRLQETKLSEISDEVAQGFTPLSLGIRSWLPLTGVDPWIVLSDGGDSQPNQPWPQQLKDMGRRDGLQRGLILASPHAEQDNIWLEMVGGPDFGFDQKNIELETTVHRRGKSLDQELTVQLQASVLARNLASLNVTFRPGESQLTVTVPMPPLPRGTHLIKVQALPVGNESTIWDNTLYKSLEILPNTIGILHLLGSPSWDGRFVRRYLKSEPKYDMISFFILRDPTDMQLTNERELSLIPFPVDRLFNEELPNFRAVVIQNFSLYQFLEPGYQKNLVDFVMNGGGLLFIGGPRALHELDLSGSPLATLLPFKTAGASARKDDAAAWLDAPAVPYDPNLKFTIKAAEPDREKRTLATVFEDWIKLDLNLNPEDSFKGLHRLDQVQLQAEGVTPLLMAETADGKESLLAAASYPGKGRAIWLFSDSLWQLAMNPGPKGSRETYHSFLRSAMTWLLREEMQRPLWLQELSLQTQGSYTPWSVRVRGPAARFINEGSDWQFRVCGQVVPSKDVLRQMVSGDQWVLSGTLPSRLASGLACELNIEGTHPAFGQVKASIYGVVPEVFADREMEGSFNRLSQLQTLTGAALVELESEQEKAQIQDWLAKVTGDLTTIKRTEQKVIPDYYWVFSSGWALLLLLCLPLEVIVRRWDALFGTRGFHLSHEDSKKSGADASPEVPNAQRIVRPS